MVSYIILICSVLASTGALSPRLSHQNNAASESQIRFAIENKYDDTGPGATGRESAYSTYKTLEEALISYLDDPDTKLPNYERERALAGLQIPPIHTPIRQYPKSVEEYTGYKNTERPEQIRYNTPKQFYSPVDINSYELNNIQNNYLKVNDGLRVQRVQPIKSRPLNLAHYQQNPQIEENFNSFDPNPQYSFSYGVHDKVTGDRKSAHESREGGVVRGYYSFMDPEGSQRTVHYTADDLRGFRATVQRSP